MALPIEIGAALASGGMSLLNTGAGQLLGTYNARYAQKLQKEMLDYQWKNFSSPSAQARALAEAGLNPSVAFGQGSISHVATPQAAAQSIAPVDVGLSGSDLMSSILALSEAKKAGSEAAGREIENEVARKTLNDRIAAAAKANKWTDEQINLAQQQAYNLQGTNTQIQEIINNLRKEGQKLDFDNEHMKERFDAEMRSYADKHNIDEQTFNQMKEQAPSILEKLKSEAAIYSLDAELQGDWKSVTTKLGVTGKVLEVFKDFLRLLSRK